MELVKPLFVETCHARWSKAGSRPPTPAPYLMTEDCNACHSGYTRALPPTPAAKSHSSRHDQS